MALKTARAGDRSQEGTYWCTQCGSHVELEEAEKVPICFNCGNTEFSVNDIRPLQAM